MASEIQFGSVLDRSAASKLWWLLIVPLVLGIGAVIWWGMDKVSASDALSVQLREAQGQLKQYEDTLRQRDELLRKAHADEDLLTSAGQATAILYQATPGATESGVVIASPAQHAARIYLYGLGTPPEGQQYGVVARSPEGPKLLGRVLAGEQGDAFLLAREVPESTTSLELAFVPVGEGAPGSQGAASQGQGSAQPGSDPRTPLAAADVKPRVTARYPASEKDRGLLMEPVSQDKPASQEKPVSQERKRK